MTISGEHCRPSEGWDPRSLLCQRKYGAKPFSPATLPLNYELQTFVTLDGLIRCGDHTAFFNFNDGRCFDGPCIGDGLVPLPVPLDGNTVIFDTPAG